MKNINDEWYTVSENNECTDKQYIVDETDNHDDICISISTAVDVIEDIEEEADRPSKYTFKCPECGDNDLWCLSRNADVIEKVILRDTEVKDTDITDDNDGYITIGYEGGELDHYFCSLCGWEVPIDDYPGEYPEQRLIAFLKEQQEKEEK